MDPTTPPSSQLAYNQLVRENTALAEINEALLKHNLSLKSKIDVLKQLLHTAKYTTK